MGVLFGLDNLQGVVLGYLKAHNSWQGHYKFLLQY